MTEYIRRDTITLTDFEIVMCDGDYKEALAILLNKVKKAPAVDVMEVKHGWLLNPNPYGECSLCGHLIDIRDSHNYCPNCGAKMDGGHCNER